MKIKINEFGCLELERNNIFKPQVCPKMSRIEGEREYACGDWCPLFGDVYRGSDRIIYQSNLRLCDTTIEGDITDERKSE